MNRLHFILLLSTVIFATVSWHYIGADRSLREPDAAQAAALSSRIRQPDRGSRGPVRETQALSGSLEPRIRIGSIERPIGAARFAPSYSRRKPVYERIAAGFPEAFPLSEFEWRDAYAEEAGLEPFREEPITIDMDPFDNPWGGDWKDQGGGG